MYHISKVLVVEKHDDGIFLTNKTYPEIETSQDFHIRTDLELLAR